MDLTDNAAVPSSGTVNGIEKQSDSEGISAMIISEPQDLLNYEINDPDDSRQWPYTKRLLVSLAPIIGAITV
jgi:hypothetical protein